MPITAVRPDTSRWLSLAVLSAGMLMVILDGTIVSVALPSIQADLGFTRATLTWTVNAYLVAVGGLLMVCGRLGDLYGRRRMFVLGLVLFTAASLLCGLATEPWMLVSARFLQGTAAAMASSVVLGMVVALFPDHAERGKALAVYSFVGAAGAGIGLLLGGVLTSTAGWRWIFFVNLPIGALVAVLALRTVAPDPGRDTAARPDLPGGALVTAGSMLLVYAVVGGSGSRPVVAGAAVVLLAAFVVRQRLAAQPLMPLRIFRSRAMVAGNLAQFLVVAGMLGFQYVVALHLQQALGYSSARTGLAIVPIPVVIGLVALGLSARIIARFGARRVLLAGQVLIAPGLLLLARTSTEPYLVGILPALLLLGLGAGLTLPAVNAVMMSDATPQDAGLTSGIANTSQQLGGAFGTAGLAAIAAAVTGAGHTDPGSLTRGFEAAFLAGAALAACAIAVTAALAPKP